MAGLKVGAAVGFGALFGLGVMNSAGKSEIGRAHV